MSAVTSELPTDAIVESIKSELQCAQRTEVTGSDLSSSIKTVVVLDFGLTVAELPEVLLNLFSEAKLEPRKVFKLNDILSQLVA